MLTIILLSVVGTIIAVVVGTLWYSNKTPMGRIHMQYLGFYNLSEEEQKRKMEKAKPMMMKMYAGQMALSFLTAFAVVFIITMSMKNGLPFGSAVGFITINWLCFMVPIVGSAILWSNCDRKIVWQKFFSDISANLLVILLIAFMVKLFV